MKRVKRLFTARRALVAGWLEVQEIRDMLSVERARDAS
jgi:hypothetical protein